MRGEKHGSAASHTPLTGDLVCNPGMCPDRESNQRPFALWDGAQPTEPHQSGLNYIIFFTIWKSVAITSVLLATIKIVKNLKTVF